jgi:hypothetical protein
LSTIFTLLFEHAVLLLIVLVALQFVIIAIWSRLRTRFWGRAVWVGFGGVVFLPMLSVFVVTERERVIRLCRTLAEMVDRGDVDAIAPHLATRFQAAGFDKTAFLDRAEQRLTIYRVDDPTLRRFETAFPRQGEAELVFDASCTVRSADQFVQRLPSRWRVTMLKEDSRWLLTEVEALPAPLSPVSNLRDWLP